MSNLLKNINCPADIKALSVEDLEPLAAEVRKLIIETVGRNGGHLGANLGVVEMTIAMMRVFNPPEDKVCWDTSHQIYPWKILTGRADRFETIRQQDGISGFAKRSESEYDAFGAGHAGTALSAALGMAVARDQHKSGEHCIAVVGDAAMGNGITLEALNNVSQTTNRLIVVLNDNKMSIDENVGSISRYLGKLLANPQYNHVKESIEKAIKSAVGSKKLSDVYHKVEEATKSLFLRSVIFEEFGLRYVGPVDGHDIEACEKAFEIAKEAGDEPILLHMVTVKGKGYAYAEAKPTAWHGPAPFEPESGKPLVASSGPPKWSKVFGEVVCRLAEKDPAIIGITAGTRTGCGLAKFNTIYPDRIFDVGITEAHAMVFASGMACGGLKPFFAVYSTFSQRSIDCLIHDACLQDLPVVLALDRAGFVGDDGPTHHGIYDIALHRPIPNLIIMQPKDAEDMANMMYSAFEWGKPVAIRYPRGSAPDVPIPDSFSLMQPGTAETLQEGDDVQLWALGEMIPMAEKTAEVLNARGIKAGVINARFVKPLDEALLDKHSKSRVIATFENGTTTGGFGSAVEEYMTSRQYATRVIKVGWPDEFITHGTVDVMYKRYGLVPEVIADRIEQGASLPILT